MNAYEFIAAGLILLGLGGEIVFRGAIGLSTGLAPFWRGWIVIPLVLAAPGLFVALQALSHATPEIALDAIDGSVILNALLALGLGALLRPLSGSPKLVVRDGGALLAAALAVALAAGSGILGRLAGLALLAGLVAYLILALVTDWRRPATVSISEARGLAFAPPRPLNEAVAAFLLVLGLVGLYVGSRCLLGGALAQGNPIGLPQGLLAATLIAFGASLPLLMRTWWAGLRVRTEAALGLVLAVNIFTLLGTLGLVALVHPFATTAKFELWNVYAMAGAAALSVVLAAMGWRLSRGRGFVLALSYAAYVAFLLWQDGLLPHRFPSPASAIGPRESSACRQGWCA